MPNVSTNRIKIDTLDCGEATIRCACVRDGCLTIMPLSILERIGRDLALYVADSACPKCSSQEVNNA